VNENMNKVQSEIWLNIRSKGLVTE